MLVNKQQSAAIHLVEAGQVSFIIVSLAAVFKLLPNYINQH